MKVEEVMTREVITCTPADPIGKIVKLMSEKDISGLPVMDGDKLVGVPGVPVVTLSLSGDTTWRLIEPPDEVAVTDPARPVLNETMP
jgi:predicted transcriptional regulator